MALPTALRREVSIDSLMVCLRVLEVVQGALREGQLRQLREASEDELLDILQLELDGPLPDVIACEFEDTDTGDRYRLAVETYHGQGGRWSLVAPHTPPRQG